VILPTRRRIAIRSRRGSILTGDFAVPLTVPAALRSRWVDQVKTLNKIQILTPADPALHAGITSFRVVGTTSTADNVALASILLERFHIFTVHRNGPTAGSCILTPPERRFVLLSGSPTILNSVQWAHPDKQVL
jgi:hypothetical protein